MIANDIAPARKDVLLEIIRAAGEEGLTMDQIQAAAFLVGEELDDKLPDDYYEFKPSDPQIYLTNQD